MREEVKNAFLCGVAGVLGAEVANILIQTVTKTINDFRVDKEVEETNEIFKTEK